MERFARDERLLGEMPKVDRSPEASEEREPNGDHVSPVGMRAALVVLCGLLVVTVQIVGPAGGAVGARQQGVTIFARQTAVDWAETATLFGSAAGATHQDTVTIEVKECGGTFFRTFVELHPSPGGGWTTPVGTGITSTFRAVWGRDSSSSVTIRQRANVGLERRRSGSGFVVSVSARRSFWGKRVQIQRRAAGRWRALKTVRLTDSVSSTGIVSVSEGTFGLTIPRNSQIRAFLPAAQAKPCYIASISKTVHT